MSDKLPSPTKDGSDGVGNDEGGKRGAPNTSAARQTFFGMYSGDKNQHNIQSDLKSKARRASNILAQIDKGRTGKRTSKAHEDVRSTFRDQRRRSTMNRGGSEEGGVEKVDGDGLSALKISYGHGMDDDDDLDYLDDIELPPGFESDEEEEEERKPRQTITRDTNTVSEVQSKVDKEKDKQAALMRKVRKSQAEASLEGLDIKNFESVHTKLLNTSNSSKRASIRTQIVKKKLEAKQEGRKLGIHTTVKTTEISRQRKKSVAALSAMPQKGMLPKI
ncbi:hypothetical protein TrST_g11955 [Triparma strigata]|uniref:Uncharacterized protein n=1 Tax=Triparma strigata TaxID=1606541 RepID=A0A9W7B7D5_9STRA|nr:hypothetical protein TrST_g11955 [Triparma strigata]